MEVTTTDIERERHALERFSGAFVPFSFAPIRACPRNVRSVRPPKRRSRRATGSSSPPQRTEESLSRVGAGLCRPQELANGLRGRSEN